MDQKAFFATLSAEQKSALLEKSDGPALLHASLHFGLILALGTAIALQAPFWPLLLLPQGILIVFLFTALHEASHLTAFKSKPLNRAVAFIGGFLVLLPPRWFGYFHFAHHRYTQDPTRDPELESPKPDSLPRYLLYLSGLPVWRSHAKTLLENAKGRFGPYVPAAQANALRDEARIFLLLYFGLAIICLAFGLWQVVTVWILPALLGQPFLRAYLLAEHAGCPQSPNMLEATRTTYTNPLLRWLAWNMPYHAEHHSFPGVPFHKLPELHSLMRPHLKVTAKGYRAFNRGFRAALLR
jgi:fatty acid desaturase